MIDLARAADIPSEKEVRYWAASQRVFISSLMQTLHREREAAAQAVRGLGAEPVRFEEFGGRDDDPERAYLAEVASSQIYVGILGPGYGRKLSSGLSATHEEYRHAEAQGLRISVWVATQNAFAETERAFVSEVAALHVYGQFGTSDELATGLEARLRRIAAEELSPWCKLGPAIFRATSVTEGGGRMEIRGAIRDTDIASTLQQMRPNVFVPRELLFSDSHRSRRMRVEDVTMTTGVGTSRDFTIVLEAVAPQQDPLTDVSVQVNATLYSPDDLAEIAIRAALLGEPHPLPDHSAHVVDMVNPLADLQRMSASEEVSASVAICLLNEALVGTGRVGRITRLRLGPLHSNRRRIILEWETPRRKADQAPERRSIDGYVELAEKIVDE